MYTIIILLIILLIVCEHIERTPVGYELFSLQQPAGGGDTLAAAGQYNGDKVADAAPRSPRLPCGWGQLKFDCYNGDAADKYASVCMKTVPVTGTTGKAIGRPRQCYVS